MTLDDGFASLSSLYFSLFINHSNQRFSFVWIQGWSIKQYFDHFTKHVRGDGTLDSHVCNDVSSCSLIFTHCDTFKSPKWSPNHFRLHLSSFITSRYLSHNAITSLVNSSFSPLGTTMSTPLSLALKSHVSLRLTPFVVNCIVHADSLASRAFSRPQHDHSHRWGHILWTRQT